MEDFKTYVDETELPTQLFNGKIYHLYSKERYFSRGKNRMHRDVYRHFKGPIPKGYHVHHVDENTYNNRPDNLILKPGRVHLSEHGIKRFKEDLIFKEEFYKKGVEAARKWHSTEDGQNWHREHARNINFGHLTFGFAVCECCNTEFTKRISTQIFCTNKCKSKHRRDSGVDTENRNCRYCSSNFRVNKYSKIQTCSKNCANAMRSLSKSGL